MPFTPFLLKLTGRSWQLFPLYPKKKEQPLSAGGEPGRGCSWAHPGDPGATRESLAGTDRAWAMVEQDRDKLCARVCRPASPSFPAVIPTRRRREEARLSVSAPAGCCPAQGQPSPISDPRVRVEKEPERLFPAVTPKPSSCPPRGKADSGGCSILPTAAEWLGGPWQVPDGAPGLSLSEL